MLEMQTKGIKNLNRSQNVEILPDLKVFYLQS